MVVSPKGRTDPLVTERRRPYLLDDFH